MHVAMVTAMIIKILLNISLTVTKDYKFLDDMKVYVYGDQGLKLKIICGILVGCLSLSTGIPK